MRSVPAIRALLLSVVLLLVSSACEPATSPAPPIPLTQAANDFLVVLSGARAGIYAGGALHAPAIAGTGRKVTLLSTPADSIQIVFQPGVLGSGAFAFPVGTQGLSGLPGIRPLDATLTLNFNGQAYDATSGSVEVVESSSTMIRARFDFTAISISGGGTIRARGTFWSVPAP